MMVRWRGPDGDVYCAPWRTWDGQFYPLQVPSLPPEVKWTDTEINPTAEVTWKAVVVHVGPDAPLPYRVRRDWIFEQAAHISIEQWNQIVDAEARALGIYLKGPKSVASYIWRLVYDFRPYEF